MTDRRGWERDAGQATTEYLGSLLASAVVVALVFVMVAAPGADQQVVRAAKTVACELTAGDNCGRPAVPSAPEPARPEQAGTVEAVQDPGDWNCAGFWGCTWNGVKQVGSGGYNIGKGVVDDVVGVYDLVTDPGQLADSGKYVWAHPGDAAQELVWDQKSSKMWAGEDYGGAAGRTIWNVGSWFIPGVDVARAGSKLSKFGKLGKAFDTAAALGKVGKLADEASELARTAEKAAAAGDLKAAKAAADAARRKADEAEAEARLQGCPLASGPAPGRRLGESGLVRALGGGRLGAAAVGPAVTGVLRTATTPCTAAHEAATRADLAVRLANDLSTAQAANPLIDSLKATGRLPAEFVTKDEAIAAGWLPGKALGNYIPGGQLGGDVFRDPVGIGLPDRAGRIWYEADVGLNPAITRAKQPGTRLLYSSDGLAYVTSDHYSSVYKLPGWSP